MVKETIKNFYGLVDASSEADLQAALTALSAKEVEEVSTDKVELEEVEAPVEVKLGQATLDDGNSIYFPGDDLSEGSVIYTDEALETIHPAGDVTIDNGDVVSIGEEGIVTGIVTPDGDTEEEIEQTDETEVATETTGMVEEVLTALAPAFEDIDTRLTALEGGNAQLSKENEALTTDLSAANEKLEKLAKASAAEPFTSENEQSKSAFNNNLSGYEKLKQSGNFSTKRNR